MDARTFILVFVSVLAVSVKMSHQQQCVAVMNLLLAVDGSNSMGIDNFERLKASVINLVTNLTIKPGELHVGSVLFSKSINALIQMTGDKNSFIEDFRALEYPDEETRTDLAIDQALEMFLKDERYSTVSNVLMIIMDGESTAQNKTLVAAQKAKDKGISIITVGVTDLVDMDELTKVASNKNLVFITQDFITLEDVLNNVSKRICVDFPKPPVPACYMGKADLWLVVDVSSTSEALSSGQANGDFVELKSGLANIFETIQDPRAANPDIRTGLILYSDTSIISSNISQPNSVNNTVNAVQQLPGGIAQGGAALISALKNIQTRAVQSEHRSYVAIVAPESSYTSNLAGLNEELMRLKDLEYTIVIFAVKENGTVDQRALKMIASDTRYFYYIPDYLDLETATRNFTRDRLCNGRIDNSTGLCAESGHIEKGVGMVAHPTDCDKYIQCYYNEHSDLELGVVRQCPMGLHWNNENMTCASPSRALCPYDQCKEDCQSYKMEGSCAAYWQCEDGVSMPKCCPQNYTFVPEKGCKLLDSSCTDHCGAEKLCGKCQKKPNWEEPSGYDVMILGGNLWMPRPCFYDDFNIVDCDCTAPRGHVCPADREYDFTDEDTVENIDKGDEEGIRVSDVKMSSEGLMLNNKSAVHVSVNKKQNEDQPFTLEFRFRELANFSPYGETLVSSGLNCGMANSLLVSATDQFIFAEVRDSEGQASEIKVPTKGLNKDDFKELVLSYNSDILTLSIKDEQTQYIAKTEVPTNICLSCGLDIGQGLNKFSFHGEIQKIAVYSCAWPLLY